MSGKRPQRSVEQVEAEISDERAQLDAGLLAEGLEGRPESPATDRTLEPGTSGRRERRDARRTGQQGDEHALRVLLERHQPLLDGEVGRYFYLPGGDREDTAQEACIAFAAAVRCYRGGRGSSFRSFARLCVSRRLASALTAARRNKHSLVTDALGGEEAERVWTALPNRDDPVDPALAREQLRELRPAVATLSRLERDVLAHILAGWSSTDAARRLGRSPKVADNALQRARRKLGRSQRRSAA